MKRRRDPLQDPVVEDYAAKRLALHGEAFLSSFGTDTRCESGAAPSAAPAAPSDSSAPSTSEDEEDKETEAPRSGSAVEEVVFRPRARKRAPTSSPLTATGQLRAPAAGSGERRRFLSGQAERVHSVPGARPVPPAVAGPGRLGAKEQKDFEKMRQEVHFYGAAALDKRQRKAFEAARLQGLNARAEKAPRTSAAVGLGMARKRVARERQAVEEAIDAGLLQRKGSGKKRRRATAAARARGGAAGLREDNGAFRGGVLRLRSDGRGRGGGGARSGAGGRRGRGR